MDAGYGSERDTAEECPQVRQDALAGCACVRVFA